MTPAPAGPPYVTDDPETPHKHGWEVNIPFTMLRTDAMTQLQVPLFDINFGLTSAVQLELQFPVARFEPAGHAPATGIGDTLVGTKWRLFEEEVSGHPQVAIYPQIQIPTGDEKRGLGTGRPSYLLPVLVQKSWGKWTSFGNVAYVVQKAAGSRNYEYYGVALSYEHSDQLDFGGEIYGNTATAVGGTPNIGFSLGSEWTPRKGRAFLCSVGRGFRRGGALTAYAGLQFQMGFAHKHHRKPH